MTGEPTTTLQRGTNQDSLVDAALLYVAARSTDLSAGASRHDLRGVDGVTIGRGGAAFVRRERDLCIELDDRSASTTHAIIRPEGDRHRLVDLGSKNGVHIDGQRIREAALDDGAIIQIGESVLVYQNPVRVRRDERTDVALDPGGDPLATLLPSLERSLDEALLVAHTDQPIVVRGETGSGKELVARALHEASGRRGAFVDVNCAALPDSLIEAELFGHERGAFSGAVASRMGLIESAHHGTLFLDEVAELSPRAQASLLRVLQEGRLRRVGSTSHSIVDVRVLSATHRDLGAMVSHGSFREDLYARLAGYTVLVPPLRARRVDMGLIIARLLDRHGAPLALRGEAAVALMRRAWPRNIRELDKCLATAAALARDQTIGPEHVPADETPVGGATSGDDAELEAALMQLLRDHRGNLTSVARAMGKHRQQVQRWCRRLGLDPKRYR